MVGTLHTDSPWPQSSLTSWLPQKQRMSVLLCSWFLLAPNLVVSSVAYSCALTFPSWAAITPGGLRAAVWPDFHLYPTCFPQWLETESSQIPCSKAGLAFAPIAYSPDTEIQMLVTKTLGSSSLHLPSPCFPSPCLTGPAITEAHEVCSWFSMATPSPFAQEQSSSLALPLFL